MSEDTKKRAPRRKAEQRAESMEQILDAAEFLFSKNGLHGVTLRDVANRSRLALRHDSGQFVTSSCRASRREPQCTVI